MVIWGNKVYPERLGYIIFECANCKKQAIFSVDQIQKRFSLYFIPTFSYSREQYITCTNCQTIFKVTKEFKPEVAKKIISQEELSIMLQKTDSTTLPDKNAVIEINRDISQRKESIKDSTPTHVCMCCGASYDNIWWETYGASYRCCSSLPSVEQEELWNNRLYREIPLKYCPHR